MVLDHWGIVVGAGGPLPLLLFVTAPAAIADDCANDALDADIIPKRAFVPEDAAEPVLVPPPLLRLLGVEKEGGEGV